MGVIPGGRGNDLARVSWRSPTEIGRAVELLAAGATRAIDVGEVNGRRFLGIASCGFDSDANRIANEARLVKGNLVYAYAALRALAAWKPARFELALDGERRRVHRLLGRGGEQQGLRRRHVRRPGRRARRRPARRGLGQRRGKLRYLANLPKVFKGKHVENDEVHGAARRRGADQRRPAVRRLRGRRSHRRPAGDGPAASARAARDRARPRERGPVRRQGRAGAGDGRAQPPQRARRRARRCPAACCCGWRPTRSPASAPGLGGGSMIVSATNGKTTTAGMLAAALRAAGRDPGPQPRRART